MYRTHKKKLVLSFCHKFQGTSVAYETLERKYFGHLKQTQLFAKKRQHMQDITRQQCYKKCCHYDNKTTFATRLKMPQFHLTNESKRVAQMFMLHKNGLFIARTLFIDLGGDVFVLLLLSLNVNILCSNALLQLVNTANSMGANKMVAYQAPYIKVVIYNVRFIFHFKGSEVRGENDAVTSEVGSQDALDANPTQAPTTLKRM